MSKFSPENVKKNNDEIYKKATPKQRLVISELNKAFEDINKQTFSDEAFERENQLRQWGRKLLKCNGVNISDIERLINMAVDVNNGEVFSFSYNEKSTFLIKTPFATLDRVDNYIFTLEAALIDLQNKVNKPEKQFTNHTFFGLIKLAFKQLLGRTNG
jgi:hypothetical protein